MKDTISFQTALALKEAGFPQPDFLQVGQYWYSFHGHKTISQYIADQKIAGLKPESWFVGRPVYAPSVPDLLRELGSGYDLSYDCGEFWCRDEKDWNAAEAVAAAWLEKNKA